MEGVTVVSHPLVQHKLTLIRDKTRSTKSFRELLKEVGMLLCYEVPRDLPLTDAEIETPLARMRAPMLAGAVAQDGGVAVHDLTLQLPTEQWSQITREFFLT